MYDTTLRYLASLFLDAESIEPSARHITDLLRGFDDPRLLPIMAQERTPTGATARIAFRSPTGDRQLILRGNRFDFSYTSEEVDGPDIGDFASFSRDAGVKFAVLLDHFERKAHRLAVVQEGFLRRMSQDDVEAIASRLLRVPPLYARHPPFEWNWRCAALVDREFGGLTEATNTIATVLRQPGIEVSIRQQTMVDEQHFSLVRVDLDINTSPRNATPRFEADEARAFFEEAIPWQESFAEEIRHFILGEED